MNHWIRPPLPMDYFELPINSTALLVLQTVLAVIYHRLLQPDSFPIESGCLQSNNYRLPLPT